jgi:small GTP-binding protein
MTEKLPSVVIVGRPNVGKSTIFNRLTGTRRSIVTDEPGITRDRIYGTATWQGRTFEMVDTGGIVPDDKAAIPREIFKQAQVAIERRRSSCWSWTCARASRRSMPSWRACCGARASLWRSWRTKSTRRCRNRWRRRSTSFRTTCFQCRRNTATVLTNCSKPSRRISKSRRAQEEKRPQKRPTRSTSRSSGVPTSGNRRCSIASRARSAIVSDIPGTTRDAVDTMVQRGGRTYRFVDTAGIRRKGKTNLVAEKMSVIMARRHLEQADVALLIVDASLGVTAGDANIAGYAEESGRSVIIVMNKWDLALEAAAEKAARELEHQERRRTWPSPPVSRKPARKHTSVVRKKAATGRVNPAQLDRGLRKNRAHAIQISGLRAESVCLRNDRRAHRKIIRSDRPRGRRAPPAHLDRRVEPLALGSGSGPRDFARRAQGENLLRHAGRRFAADLYSCSPINPSACISATSASLRTSCAKVSISSARPFASCSA